MEHEVKQLKEEVYKDDTKLTLLKYQSEIIDAKSKFIMDQNAYASVLLTIQNKVGLWVFRFQNKNKIWKSWRPKESW